MAEILNYSGEFAIEYATIQSTDGNIFDIKPQIDGIVVYEDLFSPFISGTIIVKDNLELPNIWGRSGLNVLKLKIYTPTISKKDHIEGFFLIYKQSERAPSAERTQTYHLNFISEEAFSDLKKISRSFTGSPTDIVQTIVEKHLESKKKGNYVKASNNIKYVSNFWTPSRNLAYLSDIAQSSTTQSTYTFFENRDGFNFMPLDTLAENSVPLLQTFNANDFSMKERSSGDKFDVVRDLTIDYTNIMNVTVDTTYDFLAAHSSGMLKTKMYIYDPVLKRKIYRTYSMNDNSMKLLNPNAPYTKETIERTPFNVMSFNRQYNNHNHGDTSNALFLQRRLAQIAQFQSSKIEIEVLGRTDYTVGRKVRVDLNKLTSIEKNDSPNEILDKVYSGTYIISAIAHRFGNDKHVCTLELIKDSTLLK